MTTAKQSEVKAWEQEMQPCHHTLDLTQLESKHLAESGTALPSETTSYLCIQLADSAFFINIQASHTVHPVISPRTYGSALHVEV